MGKRLIWVDVCKGIAISMTVLLHSYSSNNIIKTSIHAFLMPLFFVVSGYLISYTKSYKRSYSKIVVKLIYQLMIPFYIWSILGLIFMQLLRTKGVGLFDAVVKEWKPIVFLYGNSPAWFLSCLFLSELIFYLMLKLIKNKQIILIISLAFAFCTWFIPTSFEQAGYVGMILRGLLFLSIGFIFVEVINEIPIWVAPVLIFIMLECINVNYEGMLIKNIYIDFGNSMTMYLVISMLGLFAVIIFSIWITKQINLDGLAFIGENTIIILCTHGFLIEIIRLLDYKFIGDTLKILGLLEGFIVLLIVLICEIPIILIGNSYTPFLFGRL